MEQEKDSASGTRSPYTETTLLDCYMELIAYTGYLRQEGADGRAGADEADAVYAGLVERSGKMAAAAGFGEDLWREGLFPVCAWTDETLLCSDWPGRGQWENRQLQRKHFRTTAAGWQFYERLDSLKEEDTEVRAVYEFCLALGFRGRYFRPSDTGRLEDIQYTQLKKVAGDTGTELPEILFPEAYEAEDIAGKREHNGWKRLSALVPAAALVPPLVYGGLYFVLDRFLDQSIARYFGGGF